MQSPPACLCTGITQIARFWFCNWAVLRVWTGETNLFFFGVFGILHRFFDVVFFPRLLRFFVCLPAPFVHVVMLESSSDVWLQHVAPLAAFSGWTYLPNPLFYFYLFIYFCRIAVRVSILSNLIRKLFGKGLCFSDNHLHAVASNWTQNKPSLLWPFVLTDVLLSADTAHTKTRDSYTQQGSADNSRSTEKICTQICALASHAAACNRICSFTLWLTVISPVFISIWPDLIPKKTL